MQLRDYFFNCVAYLETVDTQRCGRGCGTLPESSVASHIEMALLVLLLTAVEARVTHEPSLALEATLCEKYACNDDKFQLLDSQCIYYDAINVTYFLEGCSTATDATYCPPSYEANSTCTLPPSPHLYSAYPGEYCLQQNWCKYGYCNNNTCVGQVQGAFCKVHGECQPGLRCSQGICQPQLGLMESGCTTDYDCVNYAGCDADTCQGYFSIPALSYVGMCNNETSLLCESGFCYFGTCLDPPVSEMKLPVPCSSQFDCLSLTHFKAEGLKFYTDCVCGYNPNGFQYCEPFIGDGPVSKYLDFLKDWLNNTKEITKCNTARRLSAGCVQTVLDEQAAEHFFYYQTWANHFPEVSEAPRCVQETYFPTYFTKSHAAAVALTALLLVG